MGQNIGGVWGIRALFCSVLTVGFRCKGMRRARRAR
jgi:hypothetical protein